MRSLHICNTAHAARQACYRPLVNKRISGIVRDSLVRVTDRILFCPLTHDGSSVVTSLWRVGLLLAAILVLSSTAQGENVELLPLPTVTNVVSPFQSVTLSTSYNDNFSQQVSLRRTKGIRGGRAYRQRSLGKNGSTLQRLGRQLRRPARNLRETERFEFGAERQAQEDRLLGSRRGDDEGPILYDGLAGSNTASSALSSHGPQSNRYITEAAAVYEIKTTNLDQIPHENVA